MARCKHNYHQWIMDKRLESDTMQTLGNVFLFISPSEPSKRLFSTFQRNLASNVKGKYDRSIVSSVTVVAMLLCRECAYMYHTRRIKVLLVKKVTSRD